MNELTTCKDILERYMAKILKISLGPLWGPSYCLSHHTVLVDYVRYYGTESSVTLLDQRMMFNQNLSDEDMLFIKSFLSHLILEEESPLKQKFNLYFNKKKK